MEEWKEYKIGDVCRISSSTRIFAKEYLAKGIPFYRGKEIIEKQKGTNISNELYISKERYNEIKERYGVPTEGDMLLTSVGTLGIPYIVKNEEFYFKDGNLTWFYNFDGIINRFLYYWFLSPQGRSQIDSKAIGSTQKALTIDTLRKFDVKLPTLSTQEKIASILSSLDDKIECNRKICENLEQQAQALFKSWFVDFEPFQDGNFVESELGMIPEGWKIAKLEDLISIKYGKDHKKLSDGNIPVYGSGGIMRYVDTFIYNKESVLIPRKGTLNNVILVNKPFWSVDTMFYTQMKESNIAKFVYLFLQRKDLLSMNNGSAVPSMTTNILNSLSVILPSKQILSDFEQIVGSLWDLITFSNQQISRLAQLRDTLLPKLMSGELQVED